MRSFEILCVIFFIYNTECFENSDEDDDKPARSPELRKMQTQLVKSIYSFIHVEIQYSFRRLLAADTKHLYVGKKDLQISLIEDFKRNKLFNKPEIEKEYSVHPTKGGLQITPFFTYNW